MAIGECYREHGSAFGEQGEPREVLGIIHVSLEAVQPPAVDT
jgi:hypothetical protein